MLKKILPILLIFVSLLKLFSCKEQSTGSANKDALTQQIDKSVENFNNRPIYQKLTLRSIDTIADDNLEQAIMDNIWLKMPKDLSNEYDIVMGLSKPQQAIFIIWQVESEVNNGGFNQFFFNSSGNFQATWKKPLKLLVLLNLQS